MTNEREIRASGGVVLPFGASSRTSEPNDVQRFFARMAFKLLVIVTRELRMLARFLGRAGDTIWRRYLRSRHPIRDSLPKFTANRGPIRFFKPPSPWEL